MQGHGSLPVTSPGPCHVGPSDRSLSVMLSGWKKRQPSCPRIQGLHGLWVPMQDRIPIGTTGRSLHPLQGFLARRRRLHLSLGAPPSTRRCPARSRLAAQPLPHPARSVQVWRERSRASLSAGCASESLTPTINSTPTFCTAGCTKKRSGSLQDWRRM